jgi:uncharacterized protein YqeY
MRTELNDALKSAMKEKDGLATSTLRLIQAALKDRDIAARAKGNTDGIADEEILGLLQSMIKQRRDSIDAYKKGGRMELAEREAGEIAIIERFLPKQMSADEVSQAVDGVIAEFEAATLKDMGKVMGALKERFPGRMDFGKASALVKEKLG